MINVEQKATRDDALVMIHLRNEFYRKKYHFVLSLCLFSLMAIITLCGMLAYLEKNPPHPLYFAADQVGRLIQDVPVQVPNMSTEQVATWAIEAVQAAFSYDYVNYRTQLQKAQKYFTDYGWRNYMKGLVTSGNLLALAQRKLVLIARVVGQPRLVGQGLLGDAYGWKFEMQVLITSLPPPYDDKSKYQNPWLVTVLIRRQPVLSSYQGLGVVQMIGNLILNPAQQNVNLPGA